MFVNTDGNAIEQMKIADMSYDQKLAALDCIKQQVKRVTLDNIALLFDEIKKDYVNIPKDDKPCQEIHNHLRDLMIFCKFHPTATKATRTPTKRRTRLAEKQEQILSFMTENDVVTRKDMEDHLNLCWQSIKGTVQILLTQGKIKEVTPERINTMGRNPKYAYKLV